MFIQKQIPEDQFLLIPMEHFQEKYLILHLYLEIISTEASRADLHVHLFRIGV